MGMGKGISVDGSDDHYPSTLAIVIKAFTKPGVANDMKNNHLP